MFDFNYKVFHYTPQSSDFGGSNNSKNNCARCYKRIWVKVQGELFTVNGELFWKAGIFLSFKNGLLCIYVIKREKLRTEE
jgi:hypothetical protein